MQRKKYTKESKLIYIEPPSLHLHKILTDKSGLEIIMNLLRSGRNFFLYPLYIKLEQCAVVLSKAGRRQEPILFLRPIKRFLMFALLFPNYGVIKHKGTKRWGPFARS